MLLLLERQKLILALELTPGGLFLIAALPEGGPVISGKKERHRYQPTDLVRLNCTSPKSKPAATLSWHINGEAVRA